MSNIPAAKEPFRFYTRLHLSESTGLKASNVEEFLSLMREVPGSSIYYHTHRFLQQHEYLSPEPPNDFAYWISDTLGEEELGEKLASIDIVQFDTIRALREKIVTILEGYCALNPSVRQRFAKPGREFFFIKAISFIAPTNHLTHNLDEFAGVLKVITTSSLYFHIFEARLRLENKTNDFSNWIETSVGDAALAAAINRLDPYTYALDDLRKMIIQLTEERIRAHVRD